MIHSRRDSVLQYVIEFIMRGGRSRGGLRQSRECFTECKWKCIQAIRLGIVIVESGSCVAAAAAVVVQQQLCNSPHLLRYAEQ